MAVKKTKLDAEQKKAVRHINGPFLCVAGPGSGKTTVILNRVKYMTEHGIDPEKILVVTFSRRAAEEMRERYKKMKGVEGPTFSTIHALGKSIIASTKQYEGWNVMSEEAEKQFYKDMEKEGLLPQVQFGEAAKLLENIRREISRYRFSRDKASYEPQSFDSLDAFTVFYDEYRHFKLKNHFIDFDDMMIYCRKVLLQDEDLREKIREKYQYIMVDEYQDTSWYQAEIIKIIAYPRNNLFVCGDDDQSIYAFRAAMPEIMLKFEETFPGCGKACLSTNYRSMTNIVDASKRLIENNHVRFGKDIASNSDLPGDVLLKRVTDSEKGVRLAAMIAEECKAGTPFAEMAVLTRTNKESYDIAYRLADRNIPFYCVSDAADIHNSSVFFLCMNYLKLCYGDSSWETVKAVINKPSRYVKNSLIQKSKSLDDLVSRMTSESSWASLKHINRFIDNIFTARNRIRKCKNVQEAMEIIYSLFDLDRYLEEYAHYTWRDKEDLVENYHAFLEEMKEAKDAEEYEAIVTVKRDLYKNSMSREAQNKGYGVNIMTMHAAKGLEFDVVFIMSANQGNTPHLRKTDEDLTAAQLETYIEEERRLFYVGMTRARKKLIMFYAPEKAKSEFLEEAGLVGENMRKAAGE